MESSPDRETGRGDGLGVVTGVRVGGGVVVAVGGGGVTMTLGVVVRCRVAVIVTDGKTAN